MPTFVNSVRVAVRSLRGAPLHSTLAMAALALGVGANAVIFSGVRAVLLSPLPYEEPDRIVQVWTEHRASPELFSLLENRLSTIEYLDASQSVGLSLEADGDAWEVPAGQVTSGYFDLLGAQAALGRTFTRAEEGPGSEGVIVLGHGLWQSRFGGDPGIIGRRVRLGDAEHPTRTVIGVMPPSHQPLSDSWQALIPLTLDPGNPGAWADNYSLGLYGRLAANASVESASAELRSAAAALTVENPKLFLRGRETAAVAPLLDVMVGGVRSQLLLLTGAVALVLLIACANVANLLLTRGVARQRELAIRSALGASQGRLVRQLLGEGALLGLGGGVAGLCLAYPVVRLVTALHMGVPRLDGAGIDLTVVAYGLGLGLASSLLAGLAPAWRAARGSLRESLAEGGRSGPGAGGKRLHDALVVGEVAIALALVVGAGLLVRSSWRLQQVDPGFTYQSVLTVQLSPPPARYASPDQMRLYAADLQSRLESVPGIVAAGSGTLLPLGSRTVRVGFEIDGQQPPPGQHSPSADYNSIGGHFLQTLGIPLTSGRLLTDADGAQGAARPYAVLVNQAFVRTFFADGQDPLGHRLTWESDEWMRIVGVVGDSRQHQLDQTPRPQIYAPLGQDEARRLEVVIRTEGDPVKLAGAVRTAVKSLDPGVPINRMVPMREVVLGSSARSRQFSGLLSGLAGLALVLGGLGIYGVISYGVSQRRREIAVRMALGAGRRRVLGEVMRSGLRPVVLGLTVGVFLAFLGGRLLASHLYEVPSFDPLTFGVVALGVLGVAVAAALGPALRAAGVEPVRALRED